MAKPTTVRKSDASFPHTKEALDRAYASLTYELNSFLIDGIAIGADNTNAWFNEILEAFLVHARVLITFLGGDENANSQATDITPGNFGVSWNWPLSPEAKEVTRQYRLINKHLAHLTWERTEDEESRWEPRTLIDLLVPFLKQFISALKSSHPDWAEALDSTIDQRLKATRIALGAPKISASTTTAAIYTGSALPEA